MNRKQRRAMAKRLEKYIGAGLKVQSDPEKVFYPVGTKVKLNPETVTLGNPLRNDWIKANVENEFTIKYDPKWGERPNIYCLEEDESDPKWYFAHFELIKI